MPVEIHLLVRLQFCAGYAGFLPTRCSINCLAILLCNRTLVWSSRMFVRPIYWAYSTNKGIRLCARCPVNSEPKIQILLAILCLRCPDNEPLLGLSRDLIPISIISVTALSCDQAHTSLDLTSDHCLLILDGVLLRCTGPQNTHLRCVCGSLGVTYRPNLSILLNHILTHIV